MHSPIEALAAMITPAVLISAASLLLLSTAARLGRVNDRLQALIGEAERSNADDSPSLDNEMADHRLEQLASLEGRMLLLRSAVTGLYVTIALLLATSIVAGMYVLFPRLTSFVPIAMGMLGAVGFLFSVANLLIEAAAAARVTLRELEYARDMVKQHHHAKSYAGR